MALFLVDTLPPDSARFTLDGDEARHAASVRRVRVGERVTVSDGAGAIAGCAVLDVRTGRDAAVDLEVEHRRSVAQPNLRVTIVQALAKGDRGELAVETATEAGADAIVPWRASRSVARWDDGPRGTKALARWRATARAATKQSDRAWLPEITDPVDTEELAALVRESAGALVLDGAGSQRLADGLLPSAGTLLVIVGPEGGIAESEKKTLTGAGATTVRLGPSTLRTSTAGAVALGAIGAISGRWR